MTKLRISLKGKEVFIIDELKNYDSLKEINYKKYSSYLQKSIYIERRKKNPFYSFISKILGEQDYEYVISKRNNSNKGHRASLVISPGIFYDEKVENSDKTVEFQREIVVSDIKLTGQVWLNVYINHLA